MKNELMKDLENMEEVLCRTADRVDIWQDRIIFTMAKAIYHILTWIIKKGE